MTRAQAKQIPELGNFLQQSLDQISFDSINDPDLLSESDWYWKRILLRLRAKVGFDVPFFADLKVVPELELVWQRNSPEGWQDYKP